MYVAAPTPQANIANIPTPTGDKRATRVSSRAMVARTGAELAVHSSPSWIRLAPMQSYPAPFTTKTRPRPGDGAARVVASLARGYHLGITVDAAKATDNEPNRRQRPRHRQLRGSAHWMWSVNRPKSCTGITDLGTSRPAKPRRG